MAEESTDFKSLKAMGWLIFLTNTPFQCWEIVQNKDPLSK